MNLIPLLIAKKIYDEQHRHRSSSSKSSKSSHGRSKSTHNYNRSKSRHGSSGGSSYSYSSPSYDYDIESIVVNSLNGKKIAPYYGCLLLRPSKVMAMDDPENPTIIENLIKALGAEPVVYAYRNECCGGYIALEEQNSAKQKSQSIVNSAKDKGADLSVTACPLCMYNLNKHCKDVPVVYVTDLLAQALGIKE